MEDSFDDNNALTNVQEFENLMRKCNKELQIAYSEEYDEAKAVKTAALFLSTRLKLIEFIKSVEVRARHLKTEVKRISAEKYNHYKHNSDKKITDAGAEHLVAQDQDVITAEQEAIEAEAELNNYKYLLSILNDGHVFFRNIGKRSAWE